VAECGGAASVIPATQEVEVGGSGPEASLDKERRKAN
jgi:hypothetical protein